MTKTVDFFYLKGASEMFKTMCLSLALVLASLISIPAAHAGTTTKSFLCQKTWTPTSMATLTNQTVTVSCPGVALGDFCDASASGDRLLETLTCYVNAANTITFTIFNGTSGTVVSTFTTAFASVTPKYISP
jgi:hypothetical protein